ncbi:MAG: TetR/AcrR family transcriptional regulator [Emergencia timonensis]|nr:TetR/AcrR family transcriptional regulator [Emergencia timonensis]MBS6177335.1 helix-turn-helix transcriptional regulator [Clostridiales bacterium]MCB6477936.1 TetR/AcrR family transcriptional regulator; helix-turn-helix transcriptional regulator [Emergencia timonensis]WNX87910.1 helix-turn-helix domain-containing protein [Emergencia timonensis]BDF09702.1 hypothetical protein CE91St48_31430 [Emergencia timonensis]BDF13786.1 hypothetical protein CE91St49_31330 [Emergencia timonensis]
MMERRIDIIRREATKLFLRQGYAKTQISHIAKAAAVSVGTIYHDFVGKKEIMHYILKCTIEPEFAEQEIKRPITDELFANLDNEIIATLSASQEAFSARLQDDDYHFEEMISDAFDLLLKYAAGCLFIEKNQYEFKVLAGHYNQRREQFFHTMESYIKGFIEKGEVRQVEDVALTTTLIVELLTWWTMDRKYIPYTENDVSDQMAKAVCLDNIIAAYKR